MEESEAQRQEIRYGTQAAYEESLAQDRQNQAAVGRVLELLSASEAQGQQVWIMFGLVIRG